MGGQMQNRTSFLQYVNDTFYDPIYLAVETYVKDNVKRLGLTSERIYKIDEIYLDGFEIKYVHVENKEGMGIEFYPFVVTDAVMSGKGRYDIEEETKTVYIRLHCAGNLEKDLSDFTIKDISEYDGKLKLTDAMTDHLVPFIKSDDLEFHAQRILQKYYPEALTMSGPVDSYALAQRMGLTVRNRSIAEDGSVFGQIYFRECKAVLYSRKKKQMQRGIVPANTVIIDKNALYLQSMRSEKITVAHECVHFALHRKAFELERLCNKSFTKIQCQTTGDISDIDSDSEASWMEWQANAIAPRLVMPHDAFKRKAEEFILDAKSEVGETELIEVLETVIDRLANFYDVPRAAAKARLVDVGYEEAIGTYTYIDGKYVRPYKTSRRGLVEMNTTFSIPAEEVFIEIVKHLDLYARVREGRYQYVDSHLVLNTPKYLRKNARGETELTQYARYHIEECCLPFKIDFESKTLNKKCYSFCVLNRDKDARFGMQYSFSGGLEYASLDRQWEVISESVAEDQKVIAEMPNGLQEAINYLKDLRGMTNKDIAVSIHMSEKQVERVIRGDSEGTLETFVLICLALGYPYEVSEKIIEKTGFRFGQSDKHFKMRRMLMLDYAKGMDEIFKIAERYKIDF